MAVRQLNHSLLLFYVAVAIIVWFSRNLQLMDFANVSGFHGIKLIALLFKV